MGFFYKCFSGNPKLLPKPRRPVKLNHSYPTRFYRHTGESEAGFQWAASRFNFLMEMTKFLHPSELVMYAGEAEEKLAEYSEKYGALGEWDMIPRSPNDPEDLLPWGTFMGHGASGNVDFHSPVSDYNHFKDYDPENKDAKVCDGEAYQLAATTSEGCDINAPIPDYSLFGVEAEDYAEIWNEGKKVGEANLLKGGLTDLPEAFKGLNFYQIVYSGAYQGKENDGSIPGAGAAKLMFNMLEARRRINFGMVEIFGDTKYIRNVTEEGIADPDDEALIEAMDNWKSDPDRGLNTNPQNLALFSLFLYIQRSLAAVLPAYGSLQGDLKGLLKSDQGPAALAFQKFGQWLKDGLDSYQSYLNGLGEKLGDNSAYVDFKEMVTNSIDEFYGVEDGQPYIGTTLADPVGPDGIRAGWDRYSVSDAWDPNDPALNPLTPQHKSQGGDLLTSLKAQMDGIGLYGNQDGDVYDGEKLIKAGLCSKNWAISHVLTLHVFDNKTASHGLSVSTYNRRRSMEYRKAREEYFEIKSERTYEEARSEAQMMKRSMQHKKEIQALAQKRLAARQAQKKKGKVQS